MNEPITIAYGGVRAMLPTLGAVIVCVVLGGASLYGGIVTDSRGRVPAMVIGGIFVVVGLVTIVGLWNAGRRKHLAFDADTVRWDGPAGRSWTLHWSEISRIRVFVSSVRTGRAHIDAVRLILAPHDLHSFVEKHPQLSGLRGQQQAAVDEYTINLGPARRAVPDLMTALDRFAGDANGGIIDLDAPQGAPRRPRE